MGRIAFLFAGQGAQVPGMGKDLYEAEPAARAVFELADSLRPCTSTQCFSGSAEELALTRNTQPALFAMDLACARALEARGVRADVAAGFSLGEIAALAFAGIYEERDAFALVCRRGEFMHACAEEHPGAMTAVLRLSDAEVETICQGFRAAYPVNYNCEGQVAVACALDEIEALEASVREHGGRSVRLAVSGAFHSPFMARAAEQLYEVAEKLPAARPRIPVYANVDASPYGADPAATAAAQVRSPVRWRQTVERLAAEGVDTFIEVGAGRTLSGLCKKIVKDARILRVENMATLEETAAALR